MNERSMTGRRPASCEAKPKIQNAKMQQTEVNEKSVKW